MQDKLYLFLDIDGVIATSKQFDMNTSAASFISEYNVYPFDPGCVKILNEILEKFDIDIILHTDWIYHFDLQDMTDIFEINGVSQPPKYFTGMHYSFDRFRDRMLRIENFAKEKFLKNYIILDDIEMTSRFWGDRFIHVPIESEGIKQSGLKEKIIKKLESFS